MFMQVSNRISRLAARVSEQRTRAQTPEFLAKALEWLRRQEGPTAPVVANLPDPAVVASSHIPINWYGLSFGPTGTPVYVNMPTGAAWTLAIVPAPPTASAAYDLHMSLPYLEMEVLTIDWASRLLK